jgi:hypothetical protein
VIAGGAGAARGAYESAVRVALARGCAAAVCYTNISELLARPCRPGGPAFVCMTCGRRPSNGRTQAAGPSRSPRGSRRRAPRARSRCRRGCPFFRPFPVLARQLQPDYFHAPCRGGGVEIWRGLA